MEIQSAFNSGIQGFQNATSTADKAAADIVSRTNLEANNIAEEANAQATTTEVNTEISNQPTRQNTVPDLNQSIVSLKVAEYQAKASTEVIRSADDSLGTLLDVTA
tara:strand:+ start:165 stop:482 length:318 start_codon:yes stop_codon:yes gene_type:complete